MHSSTDVFTACSVRGRSKEGSVLDKNPEMSGASFFMKEARKDRSFVPVGLKNHCVP